ncbi:MAG: hypothetical protein U5S82_04460 [Gammaproteobacteria bacterium]|nr:hypothetical protein [Gammaproteobacteria bacterium]
MGPWLLLMALGWLAAAPAGAEPPPIHGFVQGHGAARVDGVDCPRPTACDRPYNEQRLQLKTEGATRGFGYGGKLEFINDVAVDDFDFDVRELYADYDARDVTVRAGRQVITWGVTDLLFINDTFPKDWVAFFGGLPLEYLKRGSDALKLDYYGATADLELVVADFRRDRLPDGRRFVPAPPAADVGDPGTPEVSLRLSRYFSSWNGALYLSRTHHRAPALVPGGGRDAHRFPRLDAYGISFSGPLGSGVLHVEAGLYRSPEDHAGDDPAVPNDETRVLVGYSRQIAEETTLGLQAYGEWMHDHGAYRRTLAAGRPARDQLRTVATLRLTRFLRHQTLRLGLFTFWSPSDGDAYFIPSVRYAFSDALWGEMGANLFTGDPRGRFGALRDNDNLYLTLRYAF